MKTNSISDINSQIKHEMLHSDGIPELVVSIFLILVGLSFTHNLLTYPVALVPFIPLTIKGFRRRITWPRLGYATIKTKGKSIMLIIPAVALIFGLVGFLLNSIFKGQNQSHSILYILSGIIILLVFGMLIYRSKEEQSKFYIYLGFLILTVCVLLFYHVSKFYLGSAIILLSLPCLIYGAFKLIRFMKNYPVIKDDNE